MIKLTRHAQEAVELRGLRLNWLAETIAHPASPAPTRDALA